MINLSWNGYKLITDDSISKLPKVAGVYKLTTSNVGASQLNNPFYVGQSDDIYTRTVQHRSKSEENLGIRQNFEKYAIYINYATVNNQADRDSVEVALYNHYKPNCNDKDALPNVTPATVSSYN